MDLLILILIAVGSVCLVMCFGPVSKNGNGNSKPRRRRRHSSSSPRKTLPWFDKDYLERKRRKKDDIYF